MGRIEWIAGFDTAYLHWNGRCLATDTGHLPEARMPENYRWAESLGFRSSRDGLSWMRPIAPRVSSVPEGWDVAWSLHHFGPPPPDIGGHASLVVEALGQSDVRILPVVEPSVGWDVGGMHPHEATDLAIGLTRALRDHGSRARIITGDPVHTLADQEWHATDILVGTGEVAEVGVHCYAHHLLVPLRDVLAEAQRRYGLPVFLGETGFHDGHPDNWEKPHGIHTRADWIRYVEEECTAVGVERACWMPMLGVNWCGGPPWPSDWPSDVRLCPPEHATEED